jgi:uncharacterized protein (TIGR00255 family)
MPLESMTGFARSDGAQAGVRWHWEVRSVNGRGLDLRLRLANGFEGLEPRVRDAVARRLTRGNITINLSVVREQTGADLKIDEAALARMLALIARLRATGDFDRPRPETVLALKGIVDVKEMAEDEATQAARNDVLIASLEEALDALVVSRGEEGRRLETALRQQLVEIENLVAAAAASPARSTSAIRVRLSDQIQKLVGTGVALDEARLYQEAAILATRADISEEIERLSAHIAAARDLLAAREPVGRRFDFLTQEFNREANTLCSKSNDIEITRAGLALKAVIDQMREQVQNIQ